MNLLDVLGNALRASLGPDAAIYALFTIGLNLHYGYTGLLNFGHVGFMLVGAYGLGVMVATFGLSLWFGVVAGLVLAVLLALALGYPTLRLRADYFAITTIAAAEILRLLVRSAPLEPLTGGVYGLQGVASAFYDLNPIPRGRYGVGLLTFPHQSLWAMLVTWVLVGLATVLVALLARSPWGRVVRAIREDEDAARSLGKNVFAYKLQSLVVGGLLGALAGAMFAISTSSVNADTYQPDLTFFAYTILILGGTATTAGPVFGSILFWFLIAGTDSLLRQASEAGLLPVVSTNVGAVSLILVGIGLVLLMVFRPQGIFGDRREMLLDV
ncbi:MAG: branched-chain amino acid ABC transporter permease [Actinomycetota bacterium]|nr:branched-chain amino acid ABC transporter permease [Actinomycetota bacterium]